MDGQQQGRRARPKVWVGIATVFFVIGLGSLGWLGWFYWHYKTGGAHLLTQYAKSVRDATHEPQKGRNGCGPESGQPIGYQGVYGVLDIPSLGVTAPVENGSSTSVLSDAVGRDPESAWPGMSGTSVLFAHDVTWFSGIAALHRGATISFADSCWTYNYSVLAHKVVHQDTDLVTLAHPSIYLVTCWPEDALYFTPDRYVVTAQLASVTPTTKLPGTSQDKAIASLRAVGATSTDTLANNPTPMGYLSFTGSPSSAFKESPQALEDIGLATEEFFYRERQADLGKITMVDQGLSVTLDVDGDQLVKAQASDVVTLASGRQVRLTVNEQAIGGNLTSTPLAITNAGA